MKKLRFFTSFSFLSFFFCFLLAGCDKGRPTTSNTQDSIDSKTSSLNIETKTVPAEEIEREYEEITDDVLTYSIINEDESLIKIEPTSRYYEQYTSQAEFEIPLVIEYSEIDFTKKVFINNGAIDDIYDDYITYPKLRFYISNNTDSYLNITKLNIKVASSKIDEFPYVNIATEEFYSNQLAIVNQCWKNWGHATLNYRILRKDESFDGVYDRSRTINYVEGIQRIDFTDDLIDMGYDYNKLAENRVQPYDYEYDYGEDYICIFDKEFDNFKEFFSPFEVGYSNVEGYEGYFGFARIHARITFEDGTSVKFNGRLSLSTRVDGLGGLMEEYKYDDSYDVKLKENANNYIIEKPYSVSLQLGESDLFSITFRCDKSTHHSFYVTAENDEGMEIKSKTINLHLMSPRHSSINKWQAKKQYMD